MRERVVLLVAVVALILSMLCGCQSKGKAITGAQAQTAALEAAGLEENQVDGIHTHVAQWEVPAYSVHFSADGVSYEFIIDAVTGEVLSQGE